ncbi:MAG TPA: CheR family methyltransferase [Blastocatellia bacterium]|nr:CheR family methyltransferase [Blastocatellia bacterium]
MSLKRADSAIEDLEIELLLEGLNRYYGYDFREYDSSTVRRRIRETMLASGIPTVSRLQEKVLHDPAFLRHFLRGFSSPGLSMFSDAAFYRAFRTRIVPMLRTYPFIRIWQLGCSTGEETYSLAILLQEEGVHQRSRIYATDLSEETLAQARTGEFSRSDAAVYAENYARAGGGRSFADYYSEVDEHLIISPSLKRLIVFSEHNPVTDASFNEFQAVICRGVLSSFSRPLRERVGGLIYDSLSRFGVLALGPFESIDALEHKSRYTVILDEGVRFYQKTGSAFVTGASSIRDRQSPFGS